MGYLRTPNSTPVDINVVGSSSFGLYNKISGERTYNMYVSDGWLVTFPCYEQVRRVLTGGEGRGGYRSLRGNFVIAVFNDSVYRIDIFLNIRQVGTLDTFNGEVIIDENLNSQICIVDGVNAYIYNYNDESFGKPSLNSDLIPNYVTYQNTFFIFGNANLTSAGSQWFVYRGSITGFSLTEVSVKTLQTKPDQALAALRIPGSGNNLLVLGASVGEIWTNVGGLENYRRNSSLNIDYGVLSISTIASSETIIAWLGVNERSTPSLMIMAGGGVKRISTDGIDRLLQSVESPSDSTAFFYRQDGHLFYQLTFFNPKDNFSIVYDFNAKRFYDVTDEKMDHHPARQVVFFNNTIYFVSLKDGSLYELSSKFTNIKRDNRRFTIPRIRITASIRLKNGDRFIASKLSGHLEQGVEPNLNPIEECEGYILSEDGEVIVDEENSLPILSEDGSCFPYRPSIDISLSRTGGATFGNAVRVPMNFTGQYQNDFQFFRLGMANDLRFKFEFWGLFRFVVSDAVLEVRQ